MIFRTREVTPLQSQKHTVSTVVFAVNFNVTFHHGNQKEGGRGFISTHIAQI